MRRDHQRDPCPAAEYPGVSLLNDGLEAVSREQMLEEAEAGCANPGARP